MTQYLDYGRSIGVPRCREGSDELSQYTLQERQDTVGLDIQYGNFKTDILTSITTPEMHIRKARNFADSVGSNLILPFANQKLAEYFNKLPETYLFNRKQLKNKIILHIK